MTTMAGFVRRMGRLARAAAYLLAGGHDHDRAGRVMDQLVADRAERLVRKPVGVRATTGANHDEVSTVRSVDQLLGSEPVDRVDCDRFRRAVSQLANGLVGQFPSCRARFVQQGLVLWIGDRDAGPEATCYLVNS